MDLEYTVLRADLHHDGHEAGVLGWHWIDVNGDRCVPVHGTQQPAVQLEPNDSGYNRYRCCRGGGGYVRPARYIRGAV